MGKGRLEAFSDGVIAILITIMVLELKVPHDASIAGLEPLLPVFFSYLLSFIYIGIYWNNHHHMLQIIKSVNGRVLWANMHLLFWLSLIPFVTGWMGENHFSKWPVVGYGTILFMNAIAYTLLAKTLMQHNGKGSPLRIAFGKDWKGKLSILIYLLAIIIALCDYSFVSLGCYIVVALIWLIPDKRIERLVIEHHQQG